MYALLRGCRLHTGLFAGLLGLATSVSTHAALGVEPAARWLAGDFHNHSRLTDGSYDHRTVFEKATHQFGLDWIANAEHGGAYPRNLEGQYWNDPAIQPPVKLLGDPKVGKNNRPYMWRWQSLIEYSFPAVQAARNNSNLKDKLLLQGLELNCPAHDHVSVCILADSVLPIAEFCYHFDGNDSGTSGGPAGKWTGKNTTNDHAKALQAITWLDTNYRDRSWFIANHPERSNKVRIEDLRDFNNAAPEIAFGFEGAPGHHKDKNRGGFSERAFSYKDNGMGDATYGGVGPMLARVGGVWDALLGEGRRFYTFANSDFHDDGRDFFPGEYHKTYVKIAGPLTDRALLETLRAGRSFFVAGDLVDAIEFQANSPNKTLEMGDTLQVRPGASVTLTMRLHDPKGKNCLGDDVSLRGFDLIGGDVTGPISKYLADGKTPNPAYTAELNPSTRILAHFDSATWKTHSDGWIVASYTFDKIDHDMYVRLRGTNLAPSTRGQTDEHSNPLSDASPDQDGLDGPDEARADLWFYSNPVFIRTR